MIDFSHIERYRENNRIEAKRATGGFPGSLWETYSAFANTHGGVILLGVEEKKDRSLSPVGLPDPDRTVREFWDQVNDPRVASTNILSDSDLRLDTVDGRTVLSITVPRAPRHARPVYIGGNPFTGTYRRNGEGDYRCSMAEVEAMQRDAALFTQDMVIIEGLDHTALDPDTVVAYRAAFRRVRSGHAWEGLDNREFLLRVGALARDRRDRIRPTGAGLLLLGKEEAIRATYPAFSLSLTEGDMPLLTPCNLFGFSLAVSAHLEIAFAHRPGGEAMLAAALQALSNALIHADYHIEGGVSVRLTGEALTVENAGGFRVDPAAARYGGLSDPRNASLARLFHYVGTGERVGGGVPMIFAEWTRAGLAAPTICESFEPERTVMTLPLRAATGEEKSTTAPGAALRERALAIDALTNAITLSPAALAAELSLSADRARALLDELVASGVARCHGEEGEPLFSLRA